MCKSSGVSAWFSRPGVCHYARVRRGGSVPRGDLEGGPKDLGAHEFGHGGQGAGGCCFVGSGSWLQFAGAGARCALRGGRELKGELEMRGNDKSAGLTRWVWHSAQRRWRQWRRQRQKRRSKVACAAFGQTNNPSVAMAINDRDRQSVGKRDLLSRAAIETFKKGWMAATQIYYQVARLVGCSSDLIDSLAG